MEVLHSIKIDIDNNGIPPSLTVMQNDSSRKISVDIYSNNTPWNIPVGASAYVAFVAPSGENFRLLTSGGNNVVSFSGNKVMVSITEELTAEHGAVSVVIVFVDQDGNKLATFPINISVLENPDSVAENAKPIVPELYDQIMATIAIERERIDSLTPENIGALPAEESENSAGCYFRMVNGVVEWINPPMQLGVEYRTTERFNGKIVYKCVLNISALPNNSTMSVSHGLHVFWAIDISIMSPTSVTTLNRHKNITELKFNQSDIIISTNADMSSFQSFATLTYTKN